jgi:uncharacterized lipoprotein NlpE involved in copper resistance
MWWKRIGTTTAMLAAVAAAGLPSCTTFIEPTTCDQGSTACAGIHDARFCDDVAIAVQGADCAALGVVEGKHFCVVTTTACTDTRFAVKNRHCEVLQYRAVRDSMQADCAPGTPMFVNP